MKNEKESDVDERWEWLTIFKKAFSEDDENEN